MSDSGSPAAPGGKRDASSWSRIGIHALALLGALAILAFLGLIAVMILFSEFGREYQPAKVAAEKRETSFTVGGAQDLRGTSLMQMTISASGGRGNSYGSLSGSGPDNRNILLIDKTTGASRKLLPDNQHHLIEARFLSAEAEVGQERDEALVGDSAAKPSMAPVAYYLMDIGAAGDEGKPAHDILVGTLSNGRQDYVMRGIDGIDTVWMRSPTQIAMIVRERLGLYYRVVDIPGLKVVASRKIEID